MTTDKGSSGTPAANARRSRRTPTPSPGPSPTPEQTLEPGEEQVTVPTPAEAPETVAPETAAAPKPTRARRAKEPAAVAPVVPAQSSRKPRSRKAGATVVVTGAAGVIGQALLRRLCAEPAVGKIVAIDVRRPDSDDTAQPGEPGEVTWRTGDVRDPALAQRLTGADAVVHLAVDWSLDSPLAERSALNVRGTQTVVTAAAAAGVARVVVVTASAVYGALADNPTPLAEDAPLNAPAEGILADLLEMERVARDARRVHPGLAVTVVRPAALVGPGVDTLVTRHFASPRLLCIKDAAPTWQFCHVDDLASALEYAALGKVAGEVTVGSDGYLEQSRVEDVSGMKRVEVSASLAFATAERLHRVGVTPAPASELAYVMHPLVVSSKALRAAGWRPAYDNEENLRVVLEQVRGEHSIAGRRIGKRDATVAGASAAGATVAVLGAAAFVRAARRARGR